MGMSFDEAYEKFHKLIIYAAHKEYDKFNKHFIDHSVTPEDLVQIGLIKLMQCLERYSDLDDEKFKAVFQTTLFRAVRRGMKTSVHTTASLINEDWDGSSLENILAEEDPNLDNLSYNEGLQALLGELKSPIAKAILSEILDPSPRTLFEAWADRQRKEMLRSQGKKANQLKTDGVRLKHIKHALDITQKQMDIALLEIREKAKMAFDLVRL